MNKLVVINNTLDKLQKHLSNLPQEVVRGIWYKDTAPVVKCKDGATLYVQASQNHYSTPRENFGPYTEVEVWCVSCEVTEFDYSAYVPIEQVVQFIDNHGGMA